MGARPWQRRPKPTTRLVPVTQKDRDLWAAYAVLQARAQQPLSNDPQVDLRRDQAAVEHAVDRLRGVRL